MPEEKKEEKVIEKRFKPVIEEIRPEEPKPVSSVATPIIQVDNTKITPVAETNNIDTTITDKESKRVFFKFFVITFLVTLFLIALGGGIYVYTSGVKNTNSNLATLTPVVSTEPTPLGSPIASASPSGTPRPLASYKVSILNGSGQIGVAGDAKVIIEKAGFKVSSLGNADNFNFDTSLIQAKTSVPQSILDTLNKALSSKYSVKIGDNLDPKDSFDIIITIGSK